MMSNKLDDILPGLSESLGVSIKPGLGIDELKEILRPYLDQLIQNDFNRLVSLLYRLDINEHKLRSLLANNRPENASDIMAELIIERQFQKLRSRERSRPGGENNIDEDEKW